MKLIAPVRLLLSALMVAVLAVAIGVHASPADAAPDPIRQAVPKVMGVRDGDPRVVVLGSSVVIGDRIVVTAYHVVAGSKNLSVQFLDGTSLPVKAVVAEQAADLAILRADRSLPATPVPLVDSDTVRPGDAQTVVGYRQDLVEQPSVKTGHVVGAFTPGAIGPNGKDWPLIGSDTPASFGDSGGAVLDTKNRLTGIVRGGLSNGEGKPTTLVSSPSSMINAYLSRGWMIGPDSVPLGAPPPANNNVTTYPGYSAQGYNSASAGVPNPWWR